MFDFLRSHYILNLFDWIMLVVFVHHIHHYRLTRFAHTGDEVNHVKNR